MNQKGFISITLILVTVAIVAIGGYFIFYKKSVTSPESQNPQPSQNSQQSSQQSNKTENNLGLDVSRVGIDVSHKISTEELNFVRNLFQKNGISLEDLQIVDITPSPIGNIDKTTIFNILANNLYHGLRIFPSQIAYHIKGTGELDSVNGNAVKNLNDFNIPTTPKITMYEAVNSVRTKMRGSKYTAELVVYIKNSDKGKTIYEIGADGGSKPTGYKSYPADSFALAWEIHTDNRQLPSQVATVDASTGELIRYFNGIIN